MKGRYTFTIIKPGVVERDQIGPVLAMINGSGFHIAAMKYIQMTRHQAEAFYAVHQGKPFYEGLIDFMTSGPAVVAILEKDNAVEDFRALIGPTDPTKAKEGTIRKRFAENTQRNAVHGSDSDENARRESDFFFSKTERYWKDKHLSLD
jgi:nucleoside-diphosphate kinase